MKINELNESSTSSGSVATVAQPMTGGPRRRATPVGKGVYNNNNEVGNLLTGKKSKKPFSNSLGESTPPSKDYLKINKNIPAELRWLENKIESLKDKYNRKPSTAREIRDLMRQIKERGGTLNKPDWFKNEDMPESDLREDDLILVPGQGHKLKTGFIPQKDDRRDHEVEMAKSDLFQAAKHAKKIYELIKDVREDEGLPGWVQEKIIKSNDYLTAVSEYLEHKAVAAEGTLGQIAGTVAGAALAPEIPGSSYIGGKIGSAIQDKIFSEMTGGVIAGGGVGEGAEKPDMHEQLKAALRQAKKEKNATKVFYYSWAIIKGLSAVASYEKFINSWAGEKWFAKHKGEIEKFAKEENSRFQQNYKIETPKGLSEMTGGVVGGGGVGEGASKKQKSKQGK